MEGFYNNSGYMNNRNRKKTLILDLDDSAVGDTHLGAGTEFRIDLIEPLIIDKHSEIYLDNFLTFNCNLSDTHHQTAFALKINEFNINSGVASNISGDTITRSIIIPNDNNNINNYFGSVLHKGKKFNYLCDINPITLSSISGKITDLNGSSMFHGTDSIANRFTYAIVGIDSWDTTSDTKRALNKGETVTSITSGGTAATANVRILTDTLIDASVIYFTTTSVLIPHEWDTGNIVFDIQSVPSLFQVTYDFTLTRTGVNQGMKLLSGNARFTAEFSIISRE